MAFISDSNKTYFDDQPATADILNSSGTQGALVVGTTAVEVKVGASRLEGRKEVTLLNNSNTTIYWGYTNAVTVSTGTAILKNQMVTWSCGDNLSIYVIAGSAGNNCRITEAG
jgi:hypothetical protein